MKVIIVIALLGCVLCVHSKAMSGKDDEDIHILPIDRDVLDDDDKDERSSADEEPIKTLPMKPLKRVRRDYFCTAQWDPVCGSDGKTYGNSCEFQLAQKKNSALTLKHKGEC